MEMDAATTMATQDNMAAAQGFGIGGVIGLLFILLFVVSMWKIFSKAGKPGWACLVPFYNMIVMLEIAGKPMWHIVLFFIPLANLYVHFSVHIALARSFGKGTGFGIGLAVMGFIFYPVLAFGDAQYQAPRPGNGPGHSNQRPAA